MTIIYRQVDIDTRSITTDRRCYAGNVYDNQSTVIKFSIKKGGEDWDPKEHGYKSFLVTNVYNECGDPYIYGEDTAPLFDGTTFSVPYELTSRLKSSRIEYQIWYILAEVADGFNGTPEGLISTQYLLTAVDSIAIKPSCVKPPKCGCGPDMGISPMVPPTIMGGLEILKDNAVIRPISKGEHINEFGEVQGIDLKFRSLSGMFQDLWLNIPLLNDAGKMQAKDLPTGNGYGQIPVLKSMVGNKQTIMFDGEAGGFIGARLPASLKYIPQTASENGGVVKRHLIVLQDAAGGTLSEVDLPIENLITGAEYDPASKSITFHFEDESMDFSVPINDLVDIYEGKPGEIEISRGTNTSANNATYYTIALSPQFLSRIADIEQDLGRHKDDRNNPHNVTKAQVGLDQVDNTSDANKPVSVPQQNAIQAASDALNTTIDGVRVRVNNLETQLNGSGGEGGIIEKHNEDIARIDAENTAIRFELATKASIDDLTMAVAPKQDKLIPGANIAISDSNVISYSGPNIDVDDRMSGTSTNPVQNKVLVQEFDKKQNKFVVGDKMTLENGVLNAKVQEIAVDDALNSSSVNPVQNRVIARELDKKANIGEGVGVWKGVTQDGLYLYNAGDVVVYENALYISKVDNNNHHPDDEKCWAVVKGGALTQSVGITPATFIGVFGNETDTTYTITHNLNSRDVVFSFAKVGGDHQFVFPTMVSAPTLNTLRVQLTEAPGVNALRVSVIKARTVVPTPVTEYPAVIDFPNPDMEWSVTNSTGKPLYVKAYNDAGAEIEGDAKQDSTTGYSPLTVTFEEPFSGKLFVDKAAKVVEMDGTSVDIPITEKYLVQCFTDGEGQARPDIVQTASNIHVGSEIHWKGVIALYKATGSKSWKASEMTQENGRYKITYQHNKKRLVGAQVYTDEGLALGEMTCTDNVLTIYADIAIDGEVIVI